MAKKLTLTLDREASDKLRMLVMNLPTAPRTISKTIRIALHLLETCFRVQREGGEIVSRAMDGTEKVLEIG